MNFTQRRFKNFLVVGQLSDENVQSSPSAAFYRVEMGISIAGNRS